MPSRLATPCEHEESADGGKKRVFQRRWLCETFVEASLTSMNLMESRCMRPVAVGMIESRA
jgi:hypothetical protein